MASEWIEVAAGILIGEDGRILITQRPRDKHLGGLWEFPGGKRDEGETFVECLRRELLEELGVEVEVGELFHETRHAYGRRGVHLRFYRCALIGGSPRPLGVADIRWVAPAELGGFAFPPADAELLELLKTT